MKKIFHHLVNAYQSSFDFLMSKVSVNVKLVFSFLLIISLSFMLNVILISNFWKYNNQYNQVVSTITITNSMSRIASEKISSEIWFIVAGRTDFNKGKQYEYLKSIRDNIEKLKKLDPTEESIIRLDILSRTLDTLKKYIDELGYKMSKKSKYEENVKIWNTICEIASLIEDNINEYKIFETNRVQEIYQSIWVNFRKWLFNYVLLTAIIILLCFVSALLISHSIANPIRLLYESTSSITSKYFKLPREKLDEIKGLRYNFELLISELEELIKKSVIYHEDAKKAELKALQGQINPHFLYNSLNTVIGLIENNRNKEAIEVIKYLSNFYRISLSKGKMHVNVREEIFHVEYYLKIQKIRFMDMIDYEINIDDKIWDAEILKFILQPIVENAIYHGIIPKKNLGKIKIDGYLEGNNMVFEIFDNGVGISSDKLNDLRKILGSISEGDKLRELGYGLFNINQRIKIYYGEEYGVHVDSKLNEWTKVKIVLPFIIK
ncbi:MAG: histidine kinase [Candidatus Parvarchaeota archaeon]|nr:histidine kinase [Candidatus Rehaiarchaeum fermentans]